VRVRPSRSRCEKARRSPSSSRAANPRIAKADGATEALKGIRGRNGIDTLATNEPGHVLDWVMQPIFYARHRFPPDIIRHAVWLYLRFTLSYRDVEDLLAERGLMVKQ
jgi:hypothetical protein